MPFPIQNQLLESLRQRLNIQGHITGQLLDDLMPVASVFSPPVDQLQRQNVHLVYAAATSPAVGGSFSFIIVSGTAENIIATLQAVWSPVQVEVAIFNGRTGGAVTRGRHLDFRDANTPPIQVEVAADIASGAPNHLFLKPGRNVFAETFQTDALKGVGFQHVTVNTALSLGFELTYRPVAGPEELKSG